MKISASTERYSNPVARNVIGLAIQRANVVVKDSGV